MARLDWGETEGEMLHMIRATVQTHENLLLGNSEDKIDGVVPTVNDLMIKLRFSKTLGIIINALILLTLGFMEYRAETRPIVIYQQAPAAAPTQHKGYDDPPAVQQQQRPQDATNPRLE